MTSTMTMNMTMTLQKTNKPLPLAIFVTSTFLINQKMLQIEITKNEVAVHNNFNLSVGLDWQ